MFGSLWVKVMGQGHRKVESEMRTVLTNVHDKLQDDLSRRFSETVRTK